ncbi:hypothetical protein L198_02969 [Cryptococcus wingfieldii CBS 7118]|uniref:PITH domain-containing protein n=1 Tax=Cryptococcus wingfieldii CBS 7118 TaxID=1295528 RepID=A0A1E3JKK1_9TREE|nr:hypothetical protein L198_02969 [Cryptococcus wingfieldii CBS 7118]ODO00647.1 hypothetical protein L198_02969 [Cryptococcus wingfieldii CBS 7118]
MSCSHEAHDHDHNHGDHAGHDHDVPLESSPLDSLYQQIDLPNVVALNAEDGREAGKKVIKSWDMKEDDTIWLESEVDDELIINIPFNASISLRSITLKAGPAGHTPREMHLFRDNLALDFSDASSTNPAQTFDVVPNRAGVEYQVKAAKFNGLTSLTVFFPGNTAEDDEETTKIFYIGLRGSHKPLPNRPGAIVYESNANPADHKIPGVNAGGTTSRPGY